MLRLLWYQLKLFHDDTRELFQNALEKAYLFAVQDSERDRRSGPQWLRSTLSYLEFRSGSAWRRMSNPQDRWSPERLWYLNGIRFLNTFLADESGQIELVIPSPKTLEEKTDSLRARKFEAKPRAWLVEELLCADRSLSDRKLLSGLSRQKLARLLIQARDRAACALERSA